MTYPTFLKVMLPAAMVIVAAACGESTVQPVVEAAQTYEAGLKILPAAVMVGGRITKAIEFNTSDGATWSSDDPKIATVSDGGVVTGVAPGTVTIRAQKASLKGSGRITVIGGFTRFTLGDRHACAATASDDFYCWGNAAFAELGTRGEMETCPGHRHDCATTPRLLSTTPKLSIVSAGVTGSCGLTRDGEAYCWGYGIHFVPGASDQCSSPTKGTTTCSYTPIRVPGDVRFVALSVNTFACGLTAEGKAYCWGYRIGHTPVAVPGDHRFEQLSTGGGHACGITREGRLLCWGGDPYLRAMQYGDNPVQIGGTDRWISVSASREHTCGVKSDGSAHCWGRNDAGRLGDGTTVHSKDTEPVPVTGGIKFASVAAALEHTCGLSSGGKAYCWGLNKWFRVTQGLLGVPTPPDWSRVPVAVSGDLTFVELRAGRMFTCGRTAENRLYCWGDNRFGQLGHGVLSAGNSSSPVGVAGAP